MISKANEENTLPFFSLDELNGIIDIKGRSISLEVDLYFEPIIEYLQNFITYNPMDLTVNINLEYFNTRSSRILLKIFTMIKKAVDDNEYKMTVNWYFDKEEDSSDSAGHDYASIIGVPFNFLQN